MNADNGVAQPDASSDRIVARLQEIGRQRDALREDARALNVDLEAALIAEGQAIPRVGSISTDAVLRARLRAQLNAADAAAKES